MPFNHKQGHHQENSEKEQLEAYFLKLAISSKNNLEMAPKLGKKQTIDKPPFLRQPSPFFKIAP